MQSNQVRCAHILQKHSQSRNPKDSYRNKVITRSIEEAQKNIDDIRSKIEKSQTPAEEFAKIAGEVSECNSAARQGDLGFFSKGQMQQAFEDVAFSLQVGEISQPVSTDSGIHIIMRLQ